MEFTIPFYHIKTFKSTSVQPSSDRHSYKSRNPDIESLDARFREHDKKRRQCIDRLVLILPTYIMSDHDSFFSEFTSQVLCVKK